MKSKEKVLLVGGGFISGHLEHYLKGEDFKVSVIHHNQINTRHYNPFSGYDHIVYLAAYGNHSFQNLEINKTLQANILDVNNTLNRLKSTRLQSFVYISTSSVTLKKQTMYSATKLVGEQLVKNAKLDKHFPGVIVRPYSVYGEGEDHRRFIPTVIRNMMRGQQFELAPHPRHDWIHVQDMVEGITLVMMNAKKYPGKVFEIGTGIDFSNLAVVAQLEMIMRKKAKWERKDKQRTYDTGTEWKMNDLSMAEYFHWEPQIKLADGLERTYEHFRKEYQD